MFSFREMNRLNLASFRLANQMRALSVSPANQLHMWMKFNGARGRPFKLEHPRTAHHKKESTLEGLHHMQHRYRTTQYIEDAELRRIRKAEVARRRSLSDQKFMSAVVLKVYTMKPKKPNSGNRRVARVRLRNGQIRLAYIPFENSTLTDHSTVMVYFHPKKDMVGVKLRVLRGVKDANPRAPYLRWPNFHRKNPALVAKLEEYNVPPDSLALNYGEY